MADQLHTPILETQGPLERVLAEFGQASIPQLMADAPEQRVWMIVTTRTDDFENQVIRAKSFHNPANNGSPPHFTWKAKGEAQSVMRHFRLSFLRHLGPAEQACEVRLAIFDRNPIRSTQPAARESDVPAQPAKPASARKRIIQGRNERALPGNFYQEYFGFERMPFNNTPDSTFFFPTQQHQEALSRLIYAISERKGFVMISGEIGSGKSTLCRTLLSQLPRDVKTALITHTYLDARQLLRAVADDLGLSTQGLNDYDVAQALSEYLIEELSQGNTVVILIDEAQNLEAEALEALRMISNIETEQEKLVQLILMGQPELREKIDMPELKQLRQRISVRFHLKPLKPAETLQYIEHRLKVANPAHPLRFNRRAMREVYRWSGGTPRIVNTLCDNALLTAYGRQTRKIEAQMIREAAGDLGLRRHAGFWGRLFGRR